MAQNKKKKKQETSLVPTGPKETGIIPKNLSPEGLIYQAIKQGTPVEHMERIIAMGRELRAEQAKQAYYQAMADLQSVMPTIRKKKEVKNKDGTKRYAFAPLESIIDQVGALIREHGFSYKITTDVDEKWVKAVVHITHVQGHTEDSDFKVPVDTESYMTAPQKFASALTFAKRYAFIDAFGIVTADEDNDAASAPVETTEQRFDKAKKMVTASKNVEGLIEYDKKVARSKMTDAQKKEIHDLVTSRVDELNKGK